MRILLMEEKKFRQMLEQLHKELENTHSVNKSARELLYTVKNDIQQLLNKSDGYGETRQHHTLINQLTAAIHYFEKSHPNLALALKQVIDILSNMGI